MIETEHLILDKARFSDWEAMYRNVWSQPACARYMCWRVTTDEEAAKQRILRTIAFQREHDTYLVYEKGSGQAIGFAGVEEAGPRVYQEAGICLGPRFMGRGLGREIVEGLLRYCKETFGAEEFLYTTRADNLASVGLARACGFTLLSSEVRTSPRDGGRYRFLRYRLKL